MEMLDLSVQQIALRLGLAILFAGCIGFDREFKSRPAGMRTHVLVCVSAVVVALIQRHIQYDAIAIAISNPEIAGIIRSDPARLICQVISGIGFLGAGTIIITKRSIMGLTTAASLWSVAGLGLALGMGYYTLAIASFLTVILVLTLWQKIIHVPSLKRIEVRYKDALDTKETIKEYFKDQSIEVREVDYEIEIAEQEKVCMNTYTIALPKKADYSDVIEELASLANVYKVRSINV